MRSKDTTPRPGAVQTLARQLMREAIEELVRIMRDDTLPVRDNQEAIRMLLHYASGKPGRAVTVSERTPLEREYTVEEARQELLDMGIDVDRLLSELSPAKKRSRDSGPSSND